MNAKIGSMKNMLLQYKKNQAEVQKYLKSVIAKLSKCTCICYTRRVQYQMYWKLCVLELGHVTVT